MTTHINQSINRWRLLKIFSIDWPLQTVGRKKKTRKSCLDWDSNPKPGNMELELPQNCNFRVYFILDKKCSRDNVYTHICWAPEKKIPQVLLFKSRAWPRMAEEKNQPNYRNMIASPWHEAWKRKKETAPRSEEEIQHPRPFTPDSRQQHVHDISQRHCCQPQTNFTEIFPFKKIFLNKFRLKRWQFPVALIKRSKKVFFSEISKHIKEVSGKTWHWG